MQGTFDRWLLLVRFEWQVGEMCYVYWECTITRSPSLCEFVLWGSCREDLRRAVLVLQHPIGGCTEHKTHLVGKLLHHLREAVDESREQTSRVAQRRTNGPSSVLSGIQGCLSLSFACLTVSEPREKGDLLQALPIMLSGKNSVMSS